MNWRLRGLAGIAGGILLIALGYHLNSQPGRLTRPMVVPVGMMFIFAGAQVVILGYPEDPATGRVPFWYLAITGITVLAGLGLGIALQNWLGF